MFRPLPQLHSENEDLKTSQAGDEERVRVLDNLSECMLEVSNAYKQEGLMPQVPCH